MQYIQHNLLFDLIPHQLLKHSEFNDIQSNE